MEDCYLLKNRKYIFPYNKYIKDITVSYLVYLHLHGVPCIRNFPVAGHTVAGLLIEPIPYVGILTLPQTTPRHIASLIEVIPSDSAVCGLQTLQSHWYTGSGRRFVVLCHRIVLFQTQCFVLIL